MKRWMLSTDGGVTYDREVNVTLPVKWSVSHKLSSGQIFRRIDIASNLSIGEPDFSFLRSYERTSVRRCEEIFIRRERYCDGRWRVQWTGKFSPGGGEWDLDACLFEVRPVTVDRYSCILDALERKVNLMAVAPTPRLAVYTFPQNIEFDICASDLTCDAEHDPLEGWQLADNQPDPCGGFAFNTWWRERIVTECVDGTPVSPLGGGWVLVENNCSTLGTAVYARTPTVPWPFGSPALTMSSTSDPVEPAAACDLWVHIGTKLCDVFGPTFIHAWVCATDGDTTFYETNRVLREGIEFMLEKAGCDVTEVISDFFEWDPPGDAPGYVAGKNYITGTDNQYAHLNYLSKSDAMNPGFSNPATKEEWTLAELFKFMRALEVFWFITDDGKLRLEHWHYFQFQQGLDLRGEENAGRNKYTHLRVETPQFERFRWMEAFGEDFVGKDIIYSGPCVTTEGDGSVVEISAGSVTTDITFVINEPESITPTGFVIIAAFPSASGYSAIMDYGALSGHPTSNAPLGWANIHRDLYGWNRYLKRGNVNGVDVNFDGIRATIEQSGLLSAMCCEMLDWDPTDLVRTELGDVHLNGRLAMVEKAEIDDLEDTIRLTLRYAY